MKKTELKKVISFDIEETCTVGELNDVKKAFRAFKTGVINDIITTCTCYMEERVNERGMYIDDYTDADITAFSSEDYVIMICAYARTLEGTYMRVHYHRVYGYFSFRFKDGNIILSEATPIIDVPNIDAR